MDNFDTDGADATLSIECGTCVATGTTACADCLVTHLLANDDGPIDLVTVPFDRPLDVPVDAPASATDRAVTLFQRAGLLGDPVEYVSPADFEAGVAARVGG